MNCIEELYAEPWWPTFNTSGRPHVCAQIKPLAKKPAFGRNAE